MRIVPVQHATHTRLVGRSYVIPIARDKLAAASGTPLSRTALDA